MTQGTSPRHASARADQRLGAIVVDVPIEAVTLSSEAAGQAIALALTAMLFGAASSLLLIAVTSHWATPGSDPVDPGHRDRLTGLPTRLSAQEHYAQCCASRRGGTLALLVIDLDHFKDVNDTLGAEVGDAVLAEIGRCLLRRASATEHVARLGEHQFALLLEDTTSAAATNEAQRLRDEMASIELADWPVLIEVSVGIALSPDHATTGSTLLRCAESALQQARQARSRVAAYAFAQTARVAAHASIASDLRSSIRDDDLELYFQPKLSLSSGDISSVEALLRWRHRLHGLVPVATIISTAERSGLVYELTQWVLARALQQCAAWEREGLDLQVSVNLSKLDLGDRHLGERVRRLIVDSGVSPSRLQLEITEDALPSDVERIAATLMELRRLGVQISLDDFGAGFSTLSRLGQLPVDELKLDGAVIAGMDRGQRDVAIVRNSIELAHRLGLRLVAEGVESASILRRLAAAGADLAQGFHLCKPLPASELAGWLRSRQLGPS